VVPRPAAKQLAAFREDNSKRKKKINKLIWNIVIKNLIFNIFKILPAYKNCSKAMGKVLEEEAVVGKMEAMQKLVEAEVEVKERAAAPAQVAWPTVKEGKYIYSKILLKNLKLRLIKLFKHYRFLPVDKMLDKLAVELEVGGLAERMQQMVAAAEAGTGQTTKWEYFFLLILYFFEEYFNFKMCFIIDC
jgi:hypothetical protein